MKRRLSLAAIALMALALAVFALKPDDPLQARERRDWQEKRLGEIAARVADPAWPTNELARLKSRAGAKTEEAAGWLSDRIIVMRSGEWLAYANVCRKEEGRIHDLFLALGSDGRWRYSTYHFCVGMLVLQMEEQPENLAEFSRTYHVREFDGRSDECLQKTWPPEA